MQVAGPDFQRHRGCGGRRSDTSPKHRKFRAARPGPHILRGVETIDMSVTVMGQKLAMPVYYLPTALQRLFHHQGERAVVAGDAKASVDRKAQFATKPFEDDISRNTRRVRGQSRRTLINRIAAFAEGARSDTVICSWRITREVELSPTRNHVRRHRGLWGGRGRRDRRLA